MSCAQAKSRQTPRYIRWGLCRAVLKGISNQMRTDGLLKNGCYGVQVADDDLAVLEATYGPEQATAANTRTT